MSNQQHAKATRQMQRDIEKLKEENIKLRQDLAETFGNIDENFKKVSVAVDYILTPWYKKLFIKLFKKPNQEVNEGSKNNEV